MAKQQKYTMEESLADGFSKTGHLLSDAAAVNLPCSEEKTLEVTEHNMDWLLSQIGSPGLFQIVSSISLICCMFPVLFSDLCTIFYAAPPQYSSCFINVSSNASYRTSNPAGLDSVGMFKTFKNPTVSCELWSMDDELRGSCLSTITHQFKEPGIWTIVSEWNLICDEYWLASLATTVYFVGVMCGSIAFGHLADRHGRKKCILFCYVVYLPLAIGIAFVRQYWLFLTLRYWIGFFVQGVQSVCFVLVMELCPPRYRELLGGFEGVISSTAIMVLTGVAYFGQTWRGIQLALALPTLLALSKFFLIHESLRWQMVHGKVAAAKQNISSILRWNKMPSNSRLDSCIDKMTHELQVEKQLERAYSWADCFRTPRIRRYTIAQSFFWFTLLFVFYGISFGLSDIGSSIYINLIACSAAELPAAALAIWLMKKFGRKKPLFAYYFLPGCLCVLVSVMTFLPHEPPYETIRTALVLLARFGLAGAFAVIYVFGSEIFPTVIRNTAFGVLLCCHTLGGVVAPQVLLLGLFWHECVPFAVFGVCCVISALLVLTLPETLNRRMPDTIEQVEVSPGPSLSS